MPIQGFETYVPTITAFIVHWTATNAARTAPLILADGTSVAALEVLSAQVGAAVTLANAKADDEAAAGVNYKNSRALLYNRMSEFRRVAGYLLVGKDYAGKILVLPKTSKDDGDFFKVADSIIYAWEGANVDTTLPPGSIPLLLGGTYSQSQFASELEEQRGAQGRISTAANDAATARNARDGLCAQAIVILKAYRKAILAFYAPESNEVLTLPKLFVSSKPSPDAPKLKVDYVAGQSKANLSWVIEPDVSLSRFYVMMSPGARYNEKNAVRLADIDDAQRAYQTLDGTIGLGATVWFKVIAVDDDANATGSNAVKVVRVS